jgi:hypothetical protein
MSEAMRKKRAEQNWPEGRMRGHTNSVPLTPTLSPAVETVRVGTITSGGEGVALFHMDDQNPEFAPKALPPAKLASNVPPQQW